MIREAQDAIAAVGEPSVARLIALVRRLPAAIDLNDETPLAADKPDDKRPDRMPANEFSAIQRARAKLAPEFEFGLGGELPEPAAAFGF